MSYWNETRIKEPPVLMISSQDGRIVACVRYPDPKATEQNFQLFLKKWVKETEPERSDLHPEGWIDLYPSPSLSASSFSEAAEVQKKLLRQVLSGEDETTYVTKYSTLEFVECMLHSDRRRMARIYRHDTGTFEIRYYAYTEGRGGGWMRIRDKLCTFANDLESARLAAKTEITDLLQL